MARDISSYERQGRRDFRAGEGAKNPYKKQEIRDAWQRGYDAAAANHNRAVAEAKVVRWQGYGGSPWNGKPHVEFTLRGEAPQVKVHRLYYHDAWFVSCYDWGIQCELEAADIDAALVEGLRKVLAVMRERLAEIERVVALPEIAGSRDD